MLSELLPRDIIYAIEDVADIEDVCELRIRLDMPIRYMIDGNYHTLYEDNDAFYARQSHIEHVLACATSRSMYAYNDEIRKGYITYRGGIRIGVAGDGVEDNSRVTTFRHISYLVIRLPHEIKGVADEMAKCIDARSNILILSPPGVGKTTLLRDYIRQLSNSGNNVCLVDERCEISGYSNGKATLDVGQNTDIIAGISKINAYKMAVRALCPMLLATDELFGVDEMDAILDVMRCGVNVVCTMHASNIEDISKSEYRRLLDKMNYIVTLSRDGTSRQVKIEKNG